MGTLREIRKQLCATQQEMADLCQVSRQYWCDLKAGQFLPSAAVAAKLEEHGTFPSLQDTFSARQARLWFETFPYQVTRVNRQPWERALSNWAYPLSRMRMAERTRQWMVTMINCDSALEAYGWLQIAAMGALPQIHNPDELGFREQPIVDQDGKVLGERCLPGICGEFEGLRYMIWPQVNLRPKTTTFRPDGWYGYARAASGRGAC